MDEEKGQVRRRLKRLYPDLCSPSMLIGVGVIQSAPRRG